MKIRFIARKFTLTDDVKERVQKKLQKLDKFFPPETEATVALYGEKIGERIEVTIYRGGTIFRAEESEVIEGAQKLAELRRRVVLSPSNLALFCGF